MERLLPWKRRNMLIALLFVLPALINFTIFRYLPILAALRASLYNYSLLGGYRGFIGLDHYVRIASDPVLSAIPSSSSDAEAELPLSDRTSGISVG